MKWYLISAVTLVVLTISGSALADTSVYSANPGWTSAIPYSCHLPAGLGGGPCPTWVISAAGGAVEGGRGPGDETIEPVGDFILSQAFHTPGAVEIVDADQTTVSDIVTLTNTGPGGTGEIKFYSAPLAGSFPDISQYHLYALCVELDTGCVVPTDFVMADGSVLSISFASDGEAYFDPYGTGSDSSDGIQFLNASLAPTPTVPEPGSLALLGSGLVAVASRLRRFLR